MKRIITLILCLSILFNLIPLSVSAGNPEEEIFSLIADDADSMLANQSNMLDGISDGISRLAADLGKADQVTKQVSLFSTFMSGAKTLSLGLSLVNGTVSFLKLVGIMQDPNAKMMNTIYDCLLDIQETVRTIDKRTEDIQKSLTAHASTSTYQFRLDRYDSYQNSWNSFFSSNGSFDEMRRLTESYQSEFNKRMIDYTTCWQDGDENGIRVLFSTDGAVISSGKNLSGAGVALPKQPSYSDDGYRVSSSVTLPGSYIVVEDALVNGESYLSLVETAVQDGTAKALDDKALIATNESFYEYYEGLDEEGKKSYAEKLAGSFLDAVAYDVSYEIANMNYGVGTFASAVKSAFTTYSSTVLGDNGVTSPLESGLSKLSLTHAFEGEVKNDAAAVCSYLSEIGMVYGEFTTFLAALDTGMTSSQRSEIIDTCLKVSYYPICYYDSFITGYDCYCYPLNSLIEYNEMYAEGRYSYKESYEPKEGSWEVCGVDFISTTEDVKSILDNGLLISKEDMSLLYLYYESAASADPELKDFNDYLDKVGILPNPPSQYFIGGGIPDSSNDEFSDIYLMSNVSRYNLMDRKVAEYRTRDKVWGQSIMFYKDDTVYFDQGEMDYSSEGESTVDFHDRLRGDVFDTSLQGASLDERMKNDATLAERAYTYYVLGKSYGAGKYVYVVFADPNSKLYYAYQKGRTSVFTHDSMPYSMLSYSTKQIRRSDKTASVFGNGSWWIIGGGAVLLSAAAVTTVCVVRKKRKNAASAVAD